MCAYVNFFGWLWLDHKEKHIWLKTDEKKELANYILFTFHLVLYFFRILIWVLE